MKTSDEYQVNDEVLVYQNDDFNQYGTISEIRNKSYLIKFDDGAKKWIQQNQLKRFHIDDAKAMCVVCKKLNSTQSIRICCQCHRGFHTKCTPQTQSKTDPNSQQWCCQNCTTTPIKTESCLNNSMDKSIATNRDQQIQSKIEKINKFPYDLDSLTWDTYHRQNSEQTYCYCGKRGKWFIQMLQCIRCQQWFHAKCVKCLNSPLYFGDRFYLFACANCNHGVEFLRRLHMNIEDVVHLLLFNLTLHFSKRYYNLTNVIFPYARDNWHALQLPPKIKNMISNEVKDEISKALKTHTDRFRPGNEVKKNLQNWALVSRAPPKAPHIVLPAGPLLTEKFINDMFYEQARINYMPQDIYNSVEVTLSDAKVKELMFGKSVAAFINSEDASEDTSTSSDNFGSAEDVFTSADEEILSELIVYKDQDNEITTLNTANGDDSSQKCIDSDSKTKKRGRPRTGLNDTAVKDVTHDFNYSSDDTSSRGTLDSIIPPPENFSGINNPFSIDNSSMMTYRPFGSISNKISLFKSGNSIEAPVTASIGKNRVQIVRTVKRRLSANDIFIGPNMEVKRRKLNKKRMDNVEVISTSSLANLPKSATYLPLTADSKRVSIAAIRSTFKDLPNQSTKGKNGLKKLPIEIISNGFTEPNSLNGSSSNTPSTSLISSISSSPIKDTMQDGTMADLKSSLNLYFGGVTNRIENGEKFSIKGKRILADGRTQYLIDLEDYPL